MMRRIGLWVALAATLACGKAEAPALDAFTPSSNPLLDNGRPADAVAGQLSYRGETLGTTTAAGVDDPASVATVAEPDGTIQIWVADVANDRVLGWRTGSAIDLSDGDPADLVVLQPDFFTSLAGDPLSTAANPPDIVLSSVAVDPELRLYVAYRGGAVERVAVFENPFDTDTRPDYELAGVNGMVGTIKVEPFGTNLLAVHDRDRVQFYLRGFAERLTDDTALDPGGFLQKPAGCNTIAAIAGGASNFYIACDTLAGTCPQDADTASDAYCSADGTNDTAACFPNVGCGVIYGYKYVTDIDSDIDPNTGTGLPVANTFPPVFSGFATIRDVDIRLNTMLVADSRFRVLRLSAAEPAASAVLTDPTPTDGIPETRGTQNIWEPQIFTATDPGRDTAFGQADPVDFVPNRGVSSTNGDLSPQGIGSADDVSFDPAGGLFLVDRTSQRVVRYEGASGTAQTTASLVLGQPNFAVSFPNAIEAEGFGAVDSIAVDWNTGTLYVSDSSAHRVLQFDGGLASDLGAPASRAIGQETLTGFRANKGLANLDETTLNAPRGVYVDRGTADLFVKDAGNARALAFDDPASSATITGRQYAANATNVTGEVSGTGGIAARNGSVYVSNGGEIRRYDGTGDTDIRRYGDGAAGGPNGLSLAWGIDFDSNGAMYVADTNNNRILVFEDPNSADLLEAITADAVIGQGDFNSTGSGRTISLLNAPRGIAIDGQDRLWVADRNNNRVLLFARPRTVNPNTGLVEATYVLGQTSFTNGGVRRDDLGYPTAGSLSAPSDVATNQSGDVVYVADTGHNRVLRFTDADRLRFTEGPGVYNVAPGEVRAVSIGTNLAATLSLEQVSGGVSINGSTVTFDASAAQPGQQARARVVASTEGPPAQSIAAGVTFKVTQGNDFQAGSEPAARTRPTRDGGCECNGVSGPWLAILGAIAFFRRRRRRR